MSKTSRDLANTILFAARSAKYVEQIDSLNFVIKKDEPNKVWLQVGGKVLDHPILFIDDNELPEDILQKIGIEKVGGILNDYLENAKVEIMERVREAIFGESSEVDDGFEPVN